MARRHFFTVDEALCVALRELERAFVGSEDLDDDLSGDETDSDSAEQCLDEPVGGADGNTTVTVEGLRPYVELGASGDDNSDDCEHFLDNDVDPAARATAFIVSCEGGADSGSRSAARESDDMACGCNQSCLRKLSREDVETSRLNVMELENGEKDVFILWNNAQSATRRGMHNSWTEKKEALCVSLPL